MENERETKLRQQIEELVRSRVSVLEQDISHLQREVNESFTRLLERTDAAALLPAADPLAAQIVAQVTAEIDQATTSSVRLGADIALLRDSVVELDEQRNQAEVLNALVSRAANFAPRVVLFVVKGGNALAWAARGFDDGVGNNSIRGLSVSLQPDTALRAAISASQTCYGSADQQAENTLIFGRIGNAQPQRVLVVPLKVRGKAAAVFYADSADRGEDSISVEAIELLVHTAGLVVELVSLRARMGEVVQPTAKLTPQESAPQTAAPAPPQTPIQASAPPQAPAPSQTPAPPQAPSFTPPSVVTAPPPAPPVEAPPSNFFVQPSEAPAPTAYQQPEPAPPQTNDRAGMWSPPAAPAENHVPPVEIQLTPPTNEAPAAFESAPSFPVVVETPPAVEAHAAPSYEQQFVVTTPPPQAPPVQTPQFFEPVVNTPPPAPAAVTPVPPPRPAVNEDEEKLHNDARRFARLLVSEIKLYNEQKVNEGRNHKDLYDRLKDDIDRSRQMYEKRVAPSVAAKFDYFYDEMVNTLAEGDASKLGSDYPGPSVAV